MPATLHAETVYVTDILRLGLHRAADTSDRPFRTLVSGDELELLERTRYYGRVRTPDGEEGWVKVGYLVDTKPTQALFTDLTQERDALTTQLAETREQLQAQSAELSSLREERKRLLAEAQLAGGELAALRDENEGLAERVAQHRFSVRLRWLFVTALLMLGLGLYAGAAWYDRRHRQRHGGFRL